MLSKVMELLSAKKRDQLLESLSAKELKELFPEIAELSKGELKLRKKVIDRLLEGVERKPRKRKVKVDFPPDSNGEVPPAPKPKRTYTRRYKRNAEGDLVKQETHSSEDGNGNS